MAGRVYSGNEIYFDEFVVGISKGISHDDTIGWSGYSGYSGQSGFSAYSGFSGYSGYSGDYYYDPTKLGHFDSRSASTVYNRCRFSSVTESSIVHEIGTLKVVHRFIGVENYSKYLDLMRLLPEKFRSSTPLQNFVFEMGIQVGTWIGDINDLQSELDPYYVESKYLPYLSHLIGLSIIADANTTEDAKRNQLLQAIDIYKIKGSYNSLQHAAYLSGVKVNLWDMYTNDYVTFIPEPWYVGTEGTNPGGLDSTYYKSPHVGVEIPLNSIYGTIPGIQVDSYTMLLSHMNGTRFTDSSGRANVITAAGAAHIDSTYMKFGTGSGAFNGTTDYLSLPTDQKLANGNFETWTGLTDLLTNGNMEAGSPPSSWGIYGAGATWARAANGDFSGFLVKEGTYAGKLTRAGTNCFVSQAVGVAADTSTYVLSGWVYQTAGAGDRGAIQLNIGANFTVTYHSSAAGWEFLSTTTVNPSAISATSYLLNYVTNGDVYFDSIKMYKMLSPTSWSLAGVGATVAREEGIKVGTYATKMTSSGANGANLSQSMASTDAKTYTFSAWVYSLSVLPVKRLFIHDGTTYSASSYHGGTGWEHLSVTQTTKTGSITVTFHCNINNTGSGDITYFDSAFVTNDATVNFNFGSADFTIDTWIRFAGLPASTGVCTLYYQGSDATNYFQIFLYNNVGHYQWYIQTYNLGILTSIAANIPVDPVIGLWYHLEVCKSVGLVTFRWNGVTIGTPTALPTLEQYIGPVIIGSTGGSQYFNGNLDEFRISKGIARHTADFTPNTTEYGYPGAYLYREDLIGNLYQYIEAVRPVNVVPRYGLGLRAQCTYDGSVTTLDGNVACCVVAGWSFPVLRHDDGIAIYNNSQFYDQQNSVALRALSKWKLGTGNKNTPPNTSFALETPVVSSYGHGTVNSVTIYSNYADYYIVVPKELVQVGISELVLLLTDDTTVKIGATFPDIDKTNDLELNITVRFYFA